MDDGGLFLRMFAYMSGCVVWMMSHVFLARLCSVMLIGWMLHCSCSDREVLRSISEVFVIHLVALFCTLCNLDMFDLASVFSGTAGYVSEGNIMDL